MHDIGRKALEKLLAKAERHRIRESTAPMPSLKFTAASFGEYPVFSGKGTRDDMVAIHADLNEARQASAIAIDWDPRAGENGQVQRIRLVDANALAATLGVTPRWHHIEEAERIIAPWRGRWHVERIWQAWSADKKIRGIGPEQAGKLHDACQVLDTLGPSQSADVPVRRLSAQMFHDSKHIEMNLCALLDELTLDEGEAPEASLVLKRLGLIKHPQPLLIAGEGKIRLSTGNVVDVLPPYIGIAPDHFAGLAGAAVAHVLTIENLTTFNEVARAITPGCQAIVLYTGGVPSPSFRNAYCRLMAAGDAGATYWHWGDIDVGGYRIATMLAKLLPDGSQLRPWKMDPIQVPESAIKESVAASVISEMITLARALGWHDIAESIAQSPGTIEQEILAPELPF